MLRVEELTKDSFKNYGKLLSEPKVTADAESEVFRFSADIDTFEIAGKTTVGVLEGKKREFTLSCLERHTETPEILFAIKGDSVLCVGDPRSNGDNVDGIRAFFMKQGDTVIMNKGTWHWVPFPVNVDVSLTQVIFKAETGANDMEMVVFPNAIEICF